MQTDLYYIKREIAATHSHINETKQPCYAVRPNTTKAYEDFKRIQERREKDVKEFEKIHYTFHPVIAEASKNMVIHEHKKKEQVAEEYSF